MERFFLRRKRSEHYAFRAARLVFQRHDRNTVAGSDQAEQGLRSRRFLDNTGSKTGAQSYCVAFRAWRCRASAPIGEFPVERWQKLLAVNLTAAFLTIRRVVDAMRARGWGRIVNIASVSGLIARRTSRPMPPASTG